ncbi:MULTISPECIES: NUMOD4 domain-containing protein [Flavobacterium]|uniref:NUMOD4 domain-containing protein n=1 Tax=Flavobacterium sedimenticola TaxID=3043286 RepID=A0ABT6XSR4_9FLAO|nr:NUMOD4 domain-containing protein [Flavobacterium sedimenticola]MDI9258125.1 NUMOD4 domain-containing protein [Flavobacterium sedimenticola]
MFRLYPNEVFREVEIPYPLQMRYAVSNRGRLISFTDDMRNGTLLKGGSLEGYKTLRYKMRKDNGKIVNKSIFIYKLVAEFFVPKTAEDQEYVIHLDHSRDNDVVSNLKWVNYQDMLAHRKKSPAVIQSKRKLIEHNLKADGKKLTSTDVIRLKKILNNPNRRTRIKILAKQFGISEMHINRIKNGVNWGHIKV